MIAALSGLDWTIVIVYLLLSLVIGIIANRRVRGSLSSYLIADRKLGTALSVATLTGSELGLITVMYQAQKGFTGGLAALHIGLVAGIAALLVGLSGYLVVGLRRTGVMTIPEYYEQRFGRRARLLGGVLLALGGILNMGLFLKVGAVFVAGVSGLDASGPAVGWIMAGLLALVLFYTVLGGMVSVVLTDYVQFVVLSLGMVGVVWLSLDRFSFDELVRVTMDTRGAAGIDPTVEGSDFGASYMSWQFVLGIVSCAVWPTAVTRALSARNEAVVKRQFTLASISFMIRFLIPCILGVCAYALLTQECAGIEVRIDPNAETLDGLVQPVQLATSFHGSQSLEAFPEYLARILPVGVAGLIVAAMLAAFMSTHDSYLLCWASVLSRDVVAPLKGAENDEARQMKWTRMFIVLIGVWVLVWGLFYEGNDDIWEYLGVAGGIYFTGAIVVLSAGLYWPRASATGACLALIAGLFAVLGLEPVRNAVGIPGTGPQVGLVVLAVAAVAMVGGSLLFPDRKTRGGA